ncbi:MAG: thioredoxin [Oscillospiraceae bacterium]|nr:thioredoxin [Oscillospiraceae bacterium]
MALVHLTEETFNEAVAQGVALVDFWADWCGPCNMLAPAIEDLAEKYEGRAVIAKVDVDNQVELAQRYGVMSIPTVLLMKDGVEQDRKVGLMSEEVYTEALDALLGEQA